MYVLSTNELNKNNESEKACPETVTLMSLLVETEIFILAKCAVLSGTDSVLPVKPALENTLSYINRWEEHRTIDVHSVLLKYT